MSQKLTEYNDGDRTIRLFIEDHEFSNDVDLSHEYSMTTQGYEVGVRDGELRSNLTYSIKETRGVAFCIVAQEPVDLHFTSILTEWVYDDTGELEDIIVPDEPYDSGSVEVEPGCYHVWDEVTEDE